MFDYLHISEVLFVTTLSAGKKFKCAKLNHDKEEASDVKCEIKPCEAAQRGCTPSKRERTVGNRGHNNSNPPDKASRQSEVSLASSRGDPEGEA